MSTPGQKFIKTRNSRGDKMHKTCNCNKTLKAQPTACTKIRDNKVPEQQYRKRKLKLVNDGFKKGKPSNNQFGSVRIPLNMT